jgi:hypothetical protein
VPFETTILHILEVGNGASIHLTGPNFGPEIQYGRLCDNYVYNPRVGLQKKHHMTKKWYRAIMVGVITLLYLVVFKLVVIPVLHESIDPATSFFQLTWREWITVVYIPAVATADVIDSLPGNIDSNNPIIVYSIITVFGFLWGVLLFLIGKAITEVVKKGNPTTGCRSKI